MRDILKDMESLGCFLFGLFFGVVFSILMVKQYIVEPFKTTAIEKGYASYELRDSKDPNSYTFRWK